VVEINHCSKTSRNKVTQDCTFIYRTTYAQPCTCTSIWTTSWYQLMDIQQSRESDFPSNFLTPPTMCSLKPQPTKPGSNSSYHIFGGGSNKEACFRPEVPAMSDLSACCAASDDTASHPFWCRQRGRRRISWLHQVCTDLNVPASGALNLVLDHTSLWAVTTACGLQAT